MNFLQITVLVKDFYLGYTQFSQNPIVRKQPHFLKKVGKRFKQILYKKTYMEYKSAHAKRPTKLVIGK